MIQRTSLHRRAAIAALLVLAAAAAVGAQEGDTRSPWRVTIRPIYNPLPVGSCTLVALDLRSANGKEWPRSRDGTGVTVADFDMGVTSEQGERAVVPRYLNPNSFSVCACQAATAGGVAKITATYPAKELSEKKRVPGVEFTSSLALPLAPAQSKANPPGCETTVTTTVSNGSLAVTPQAKAVAPDPPTTAPEPAPSASEPTPAPGDTKSGGAAGAEKANAKAGIPVGVRQPSRDNDPGLDAVLEIGRDVIDVIHVAGGSAVADVAVSGVGGTTKKHVSNIKYEPIVLDVPPGSALEKSINETWNGSPRAVSGVLQETGAGGKGAPVGDLAFQNAQITSVTIPTLDGSSRDHGYLRVTLDPERLRGQASSGKPGGLGPKGQTTGAFRLSNFRLTIPGIDAAAVTRIESFTVGTPAASDPLGNAREPTKRPTRAGIPNLVLDVSIGRAADFLGWYDDFLIDGKHADANERTLKLELLGPNMRDVLTTLKGTGVGIVTAKIVPGEIGGGMGRPSAMGARYLQVELYVEKLEIIASGASSP